MALTKDAKGEEKATVVVSGVLLGSCFLRNRKGLILLKCLQMSTAKTSAYHLIPVLLCFFKSPSFKGEQTCGGRERQRKRMGWVSIPLGGLHRFSLLLVPPITGEHLLSFCIYRMNS